MLNMIRIRLLEYVRMWPVIAAMTVMAIVFIYTFGVGFSQDFKSGVAVVDQSKSNESNAFVEGLKDLNDFEIVVNDYDKSIQLLEKTDVIAVIVIPADYSENVYTGNSHVDFIKTSSLMEHETLKQSINGIVSETIGNISFVESIKPAYQMLNITMNEDLLLENIEDNYRDRPIMIIDSKVYNSSSANFYDSLKQSFMGFIIFFSLFTMVFGIGSIVEDKENRVWHRQIVSPISGTTILGSALIVGFIVGVFQLGLMVVSGKYLFNIDLGKSTIALMLVLSSYVIASMCLGLLLSSIVKTGQQLGAMSPMIIVSTSMLGGCMWPLEMVTNKFVRGLSLITPQRWAMEGLQKVIIYNGNVSDVLEQIIYLLILALVFFSLAIVPYVRKT